MKKKALLLLGGLCLALQGYTQLIIGFDDVLATHKNYVYGLDTVLVQRSDLEKTGENQKWDFSLLSFVSPDTVTIRTSVSEANPMDVFYVLHSSASGSKAYLKKMKSGLSAEAYEWKGKNNSPMKLVFSIPEKVLEFPLHTGKKYKDSAVAELKIKSPYPNYDSIRVSTILLRSSTVEASGSLLLPSGENHKVLKLKVTEKQTQYSFLKKGDDWIGSDTLYEERINYSWLGKNAGYVVMRNELSPGTGKISTSYLNRVFVASGANSGSSVELYPNPARESISVSLKGYEGTVWFEVLDVNSVPVFTKSYSVKSETATVQLELPMLQPGPYHLRVRDGNKSSLTKFMIVR